MRMIRTVNLSGAMLDGEKVKLICVYKGGGNPNLRIGEASG